MTNSEADRGLNSPSDYTLMLSNLPKGDYTEKEIIKFMEQYWDFLLANENDLLENNVPKQLQIAKVVLAYDIGDYIEKVSEREKLIKQSQKSKIESEKTELLDSINVLTNKINEMKTSLDEAKVCGVVFVVLQTQTQCQAIVRQQELSKFQHLMRKLFKKCYSEKVQLQFKERDIKIQRAPEPSDIYWENLGFDEKQKLNRKISTFFSTCFLLILCFGIIFGIDYGKKKAENYFEDREEHMSLAIRGLLYGLSGISSLLILIVNSGLSLAVRFFSSLEKRETITHLNCSVAEKLSIAYFINTAIVVLLVALILEVDVHPKQAKRYWGLKNKNYKIIQRRWGINL